MNFRELTAESILQSLSMVNRWKLAFFGLLIILALGLGATYYKQISSNEQKRLKNEIFVYPSSVPTSLIVETKKIVNQSCQNNGQCGAGRFCYQGFCRPTNYCFSDSDCTKVAECQRVCQGNECALATERCGTLSRLNTYYVYDCFGIRACKPQQIRCISNGCRPSQQKSPNYLPERKTCNNSNDCSGAPCQDGYCIGYDYVNQ